MLEPKPRPLPAGNDDPTVDSVGGPLRRRDDGRSEGEAGAADLDLDLGRAVVAGEAWAQRRVWDLYAPMVLGVLRRALGPTHDFEDLLQDVFLRVFGRVNGLRDPGALRSFVYSVTVRVVRWEIRRARSRRRQAAALLEDESTGVVTTDPETRDLLAKVETLLDSMPQKERAVFVLVHVEGQALSEIAEGLGISLSTAKRWLRRALVHIEKGIDRDARLSSLLKKRWNR